tara:strand:+ start:125 stop:946 length:822 start_codon:yes stop_codon:yes gene_type:complete
MQTELDGCPIEVHLYANKGALQAARPEVYNRISEIVFCESDATMAEWAVNQSVTVIDGNLSIAAEDDSNCFKRIYGVIGEEALDANWLLFTGNVELAEGMSLEDRHDKFVIFGDLKATGVSNDWGQLFVLGKTTIPGILFFNSDNGGFTQLDLAEPIGLIATMSNMFNIELKAKYYLDPIFGGFDRATKSPHDERIREAFGNRPRVITVEEFAAVFEENNPDTAEEIRNGDHFKWAGGIAADYDSRGMLRDELSLWSKLVELLPAECWTPGLE